MKSTINIAIKNTTTTLQNLFIYVSKNSCAVVKLNSTENIFVSIQIFFTEDFNINNFKENFEKENLFKETFKQVYIIWCTDEFLMMPSEFFNTVTAKQMMDLVFGNIEETILQNENILAQNLQLTYQVPVALKNELKVHYPTAIENHQNALLIKYFKENTDVLYCNFFENNLIIFLKKNNHLQIIQNFESTTPEDAAYHLLNVCQRFDVDATKTTLVISGMINKDSNLYNEIYKYFLDINFASLPNNFNCITKIKNYPQHYFSHYFILATCV